MCIGDDGEGKRDRNEGFIGEVLWIFLVAFLCIHSCNLHGLL